MCRLLWDSTFRNRAENSLPSDPILNGINAVNIVQSYVFLILLIIMTVAVLLSASSSSKLRLTLALPTEL